MEKRLPEHMLSQYESWGSLPSTIRGRCINLVFGDLDAKCVGMLGMPLAVYQSDHRAVLIKLSKTSNWHKGEYKDVAAGEHASNWTAGFEVVETAISDGDHDDTEDAAIEEDWDVYRAEDALQED